MNEGGLRFFPFLFLCGSLVSPDVRLAVFGTQLPVLKIAKWMSRYVMRLYGEDDGRFDKNFYKVDMSSKNPRWPPPHMY